MCQNCSRNGGRILSSPFFPNPLDNFKPQKPDFEPEIEPDYEDDFEYDCPVCHDRLGIHTTRMIVECALKEIRGDKQS